MAKGKLNNTEKFVIKGMLTEQKSVEDIAKELGRRVSTVTKYVTEELPAVLDHIVSARLQAAKTTTDEMEDFEAEIDEETLITTIHKLKKAGLDTTDAKEMVTRVLRKLDFNPDNATQLYALCLRNLNTKDLMVTKAAGGRDGVAVMTQAASEKSDASKNKSTKSSRKMHNKIWQPKEGKMRQ